MISDEPAPSEIHSGSRLRAFAIARINGAPWISGLHRNEVPEQPKALIEWGLGSNQASSTSQQIAPVLVAKAIPLPCVAGVFICLSLRVQEPNSGKVVEKRDLPKREY